MPRSTLGPVITLVSTLDANKRPLQCGMGDARTTCEAVQLLAVMSCPRRVLQLVCGREAY